ncbi:MAG: nucleotidyltransferase [Gemmatimonadota bacterium]|nr:nucleotidyltransferase [Gemmatimonadota bacterium]
MALALAARVVHIRAVPPLHHAPRALSLPLVVLAAGLSTRYGRLKQLDPLGPGGEAIMDFNVFDAARAGFDSVTYVVRPEILDDVRRHVDGILGGTFPTHFVCQSLDRLPDGFRAPPERVKPWGTAHAVLTAAESVGAPLAVCNADDLYGPGAFKRLQAFLSSDPTPTEAALVGYTLEKTLSGAGGVARGVCVLGRGDHLERITEVQNIRRHDSWITGSTTDGDPVELSGQEMVSMNLWGFTQPVIDLLQRQFRRFLEYWGADTRAESFLSTTVNAQIQLGATRVKVLAAPDSWFGITHAADRDRSTAILRERVAAGAYPARLADAMARIGGS